MCGRYYRQSDKQKIAETFHVTKWAPDVHLAPDYNIAPSTLARPLLEDMRKWMEKALRSLSAKSESAAAIRYALSRWRALLRYTED